MQFIKKNNWLLVLVLASAILLPTLGSFGLWDPMEIKEADLAQDLLQSGQYRDVTLDRKYSPRPVLYVWMVALGFKVLGVNELAGRLPLALFGILSLLLAYRFGRRLISQRAGLAAALVLGTTPAFFWQCRQLSSDVIFYASLLASVGGMAAYIWPVSGKRCRWDLILAGLGLVAGFLSRGLLLGTLFPLICMILAVALSWRTPDRAAGEPAPEEDPESEAAPVPENVQPAADFQAGRRTGQEAGPSQSEAEAGAEADADADAEADAEADADADADADTEAGAAEEPALAVDGTATVGSAIKAAALPLLAMLAVSGAAIGALLATLKGRAFLLLGAEFRRLAIPPTFETTFKDLGFGFYPWFALLPIALGVFVLAQRGKAEERNRDAFIKLLLVVLAVVGYVTSSIWMGYLGKLHFPALPWLAVMVGVLWHEVRTGARPVHRYWGLVAVGLILVLQQDFFMQPGSLVFSHVLEHMKYPIELNIKIAMRTFGVLFAVALFFSLDGVPRHIDLSGFSTRFFGKIARFLALVVNWGGAIPRWLFGRQGQRAKYLTEALALVFAGWCVFYLTPQLSLHLSNKALFGTFHRCRTGDEVLAQYQVSGRGAAYYNNGRVKDVGDQNQLFSLLREDRRWFILVPAHQLAPIDQAARQQNLTYYVLDDRSSQFLILSNKLGGRCDKDLNPLRKYVLSKEPKPRRVLKANFENKVELLGFDVDDVVTRGGKFKITLYFKVLGRMPSGYKLFIHFDQPANRFHGDHQPLGGKYPTEYWLPGDYIVDPHEVEIPIITTPSGNYTMLMGFWLGSQRLKVIEGPNDGVNRVTLGTLRVR